MSFGDGRPYRPYRPLCCLERAYVCGVRRSSVIYSLTRERVCVRPCAWCVRRVVLSAYVGYRAATPIDSPSIPGDVLTRVSTPYAPLVLDTPRWHVDCRVAVAYSVLWRRILLWRRVLLMRVCLHSCAPRADDEENASRGRAGGAAFAHYALRRAARVLSLLARVRQQDDLGGDQRCACQHAPHRDGNAGR